jgi:hypothetical protein
VVPSVKRVCLSGAVEEIWPAEPELRQDETPRPERRLIFYTDTRELEVEDEFTPKVRSRWGSRRRPAWRG